jgi:hypothetical protein
MPKKGYKLTPEHRSNIRAALKGRKQTPGQIERRATANRGKKRTEEVKEKWRKENNYGWKGGRRISGRGYIYLLRPEHPFATKAGLVAEHRLVMEAWLGRVLSPLEVVHHINGILDDNRIENLMLFSDNKEHTKHHWVKRDKK